MHFIGSDFERNMIGKPWDWYKLGDLESIFGSLADKGFVSLESIAHQRMHIPYEIEHNSTKLAVSTILADETIMMMEEWLDVLLSGEVHAN